MLNPADFNELNEAEKKHFYKCEQCGEMVDMRQLDDVLFHEVMSTGRTFVHAEGVLDVRIVVARGHDRDREARYCPRAIRARHGVRRRRSLEIGNPISARLVSSPPLRVAQNVDRRAAGPSKGADANNHSSNDLG